MDPSLAPMDPAAPNRLRALLRRGRSLVRRISSAPGAAPVILLYHRIAEPRSDPWGLCVSPERFRAQLAMLVAERRVLPLDELVSRLAAGDAPRFATAITFDDGYADNLEAAAPLLEEAGLPATLFVTSGAIGSGEPFMWDEPIAEALPMDAVQLREAARAFAIGAHARDHVHLTRLEPGARFEQIAGSRADLAAVLGMPPTGFAYPHGDFDGATARRVAEAGFEWAVAVENRAVPRRYDRFALPRLTVGDWSAARLRRAIRDAGG